MGHLAKHRATDYRRLKSTALGDWKASRDPIPDGELYLPQNGKDQWLAANRPAIIHGDARESIASCG